jgi:hypothetical protein
MYYDLESPKKREKEFVELREELRLLGENQELLLDRLALTSGPFMEVDPDLVIAQQTAAIRVVTYLHQNLPKTPRDPVTGEEAATPATVEEMEEFLRKYQVAEDPLIVLERFAKGDMTPTHVEALQAMYPQMHAQIVAEFAATMAEFEGEKIDYGARSLASTLLGYPTDPTLDPTFIAQMQSQGAQTATQDGAINSPQSQLTRPMSSIGNSETTLQRLLQR